MTKSLKKELHQLLIESGCNEIARALSQKRTDELTSRQKDVLNKMAYQVRNGSSTVKIDAGISGCSSSSGGAGFLSGVRHGFGDP